MGVVPFQQHASSSSTILDEMSGKVGGHSLRPDESPVDAEVTEEEKEEELESCDAFCKGTGPSSSSAKGLKRSELLLEELQRREMIRFEDELHKIILIPRV